MSDNRGITLSCGEGFGAMLTVAFIVLKLCGVINWSWWWVLCPLWGPLALGMLLIGVGLCLMGVSR